MAILKSVKSFMEGGRNFEDVSSDVFPEVNLKAIRKGINLKEVSISDGQANLPSSDSMVESSTEQSIKAEIQSIRTRYGKTYNDNVSAYETRAAESKNKLSIDNIVNEERGLVNNVVADAKKSALKMSQAKQELVSVSEEIISFRKQHRLTHRLPVIKEKWDLWLFVSVIFVIELMVTVFALRESAGLPMVLLTAFIFCILNCAIPIVGGQYIRWVNYAPGVREIKRIVGWVWALFLVTLGFLGNMLFGHYRFASLELKKAAGSASQASIDYLEEMIIKTNNIGQDAANNFFNDFWAINDVMSIALVVVGMFAYLYCLKDGYLQDDPYPEYGARKSRFDVALKGYQYFVSTLVEEVKKKRAIGIINVRDFKAEINREIDSLPDNARRVESLSKGYLDALNTLEMRQTQLVSEYRESNSKERSTPDPKYFSVHVKASSAQIKPAKLITIDETTQGALISKIDSFSDKLHTEFEEIIHTIKDTELLISSHPFDVFNQED